MKKSVIVFLRFAGLLAGMVFLYFVSAVILSVIPVKSCLKNSGNNYSFFVRTNGVHTDIFIPVKTAFADWSKKIPYHSAAVADSACEWIGFGWGNREFYIETREWKDLRLITAIRAGCGMGPSAMHVEFVKKPGTSQNWFELNTSEKGMKALISFIDSSFRKNNNGDFMLIPGAGYFSNDAFYEAIGRFTIINTCNEWTGKALRTAGVCIGLWTPFEWSVIYHLKRNYR